MVVVVHRATGHRHRGSSRRGILGAKENFAELEKQILAKFILVRWMKISASSSPPSLTVTNLTKIDKEEEEDVAEEGPREGPGLALVIADPSAYGLEGTTWPPLLTFYRSPQPFKLTHPQAGYSSYLPSSLKSTYCLYTSHLT